MNIKNIKKAIAVMERAKARDSVYMEYWQRALGVEYATNEETFHACGNKGCFGDHIAISPEFQADGGYVYLEGAPAFKGVNSARAVAMWLEIDDLTAMGLMYNPAGMISMKDLPVVYPVPFHEVKAEHVIFALNQLLALGEEKCLELWPR